MGHWASQEHDEGRFCVGCGAIGCVRELRSENERLRDIIERHLEAVTSGEDSTATWDELVLTVW